MARLSRIGCAATASLLAAVELAKDRRALVHGDADELVPYQDAPDVRAAAGQRPELVTLAGADHRFTGVIPHVVDAVVPWAAERCVTQWRGDRGAKALAKWRARAREAAKQARRARTPEVTEPLDRKGVSALLAGADLAVVLHEEGAQRLSELPLPENAADGGAGAGIVLVVGPEGGISDAELTAFDEAGAVRSLLGPSVLRTSTAGVAALSVLQARTGRW